jgi:1-phosphofructokinase family hexose kinase
VILTVTPNACVDKTYRVEGFRLDRVNRPTLAHTVAGGKGINVARVYQTLGGKAVASGLLGGINGRIVAQALKQERIANEFVRIEGETRVCIAIVDPVAGTQTEVNESGPEVDARPVRELLRRIERLLSQERFEFVVLSGSLPPGVPATLYADLIGLTHRYGVRAVLDASGAALREGVCASPWLVKPNRAELEGLVGYPLETRAELLAAGRTLQTEHGIDLVALTLGAQGALLVTGDETWQAVPPSIQFVSAVASGDSFVAALLWGWTHGAVPGDVEGALRLATGAGAANAAVIGAGFCTRESIVTLAEEAVVGRLSPYTPPAEAGQISGRIG